MKSSPSESRIWPSRGAKWPSRNNNWLLALVVLVLVCFGIGLPLALNITDIEFENAGLVAGTRDQHTIAAPIELHAATGTVVSSGRLAIVAAQGRSLSGREAYAIIKRGAAHLLLERADLAITGTQQPESAPAPSAPATHQSPAVHAPLADALREGRFSTLRIDNGAFTIRMPGGRSERLSRVAARIERLGSRGMRAAGTALWRGQGIKFDLRTPGTNMPKTGATTSTMPVAVTVTGKLFTLSFDGIVGSGQGLQITGPLKLTAPALPRLASALGANFPAAVLPGSASISGPVNWTGPSLAFAKAEVQLALATASGALSITNVGNKPTITGTLAFDELNLPSYLTAKAGGQSAPRTVPDIVQSSLPALPLGWLQKIASAWSKPTMHQFDADVRVSVKRVRLADQSLGKAAATLTLRRGKVSAHLAELAFDGGGGSGQLTMDFNGLMPRLTLRGKLINVPMRAVEATVFGSQILDGRGQLTVDLVSTGSSTREILSNLSGVILTDMPKGARLALDLRAFDTKRQPEISEVTTDALLQRVWKGSTRLTSLKAELFLAGGQLSAREIQADSTDRQFHLAGTANLAARNVDL
ncbi:MAG TPA: AsmA-like C-terminal region-containing protein, partial [Hyphomicrobiaceae bacterium]|nr:AsmA-like C-terminal region-containing protein [Hyphomicrobiaceae bacterium]